MPDHIHLILEICAQSSGPPRAAAPAVTLPGVLNTLKGLSSKTVGTRLWQRGYYEHVIRSDADLSETRQYLMNNPRKWMLDKEL